MDKQRATHHILTQLQAGSTREDIVEELSRILNAPQAITGRFVDRVISTHSDAESSSPRKLDMPDWMEAWPNEVEVNQVDPSPSDFYTDLPPGLQAILNSNSVPPDDLLLKPDEPDPVHEPKVNTEILLPAQDSIQVRRRKTTNLETIDESSEIDLNAISEFILHQLKKQHRHNDIVEAVCHQSGWHWNKSQRFVARVQTKHHDELLIGKNRVIIGLGIGIILVGLIMAINGVSTISNYAKLTTSAKLNPEILLTISPQSAIIALVALFTGIGMIIGGGFGIARAIFFR